MTISKIIVLIFSFSVAGIAQDTIHFPLGASSKPLYYYSPNDPLDALKLIKANHPVFLKSPWEASHTITLRRKLLDEKVDRCTAHIIREAFNEASAVFKFTPTPVALDSLVHRAAQFGNLHSLKALLESPFREVLHVLNHEGQSASDLANLITDPVLKGEVLKELAKYPVNTNIRLMRSNCSALSAFIAKYVDHASSDQLQISEEFRDDIKVNYVSDSLAKALENKKATLVWPEENSEASTLSAWFVVPRPNLLRAEITELRRRIEETICPSIAVARPLIQAIQAEMQLAVLPPLPLPTQAGKSKLSPELEELLFSNDAVVEIEVSNHHAPAARDQEIVVISSNSDKEIEDAKQSAPDSLAKVSSEESIWSLAPTAFSASGFHQPPHSLLKKRSDLLKKTPLAKNRSSEGTNQKLVSKLPHCIIDAKYLEREQLSLGFCYQKNGGFELPTGNSYIFSKVGYVPSANTIQHHNLGDGSLTLLSTGSLEAFIASERITFVRNGRGEKALVPTELGAGRIVYVMPKSDYDSARLLVSAQSDVLLINRAENVDDSDLKLAGVRWWAIFQATFDLGLKHFMVMDDNVASLHTRGARIRTWQDVYELYQRVAKEQQVSLVSTASLRPEHNQAASESTMLCAQDRYGYKLFYVDAEKIRDKFFSPNYAIPPNKTWALQDIFFQEVVRQAGLGIAKISNKSLVIVRSKQNKSIAAKSYAKRNTSALVWQTTTVDEYPKFYQAACAHMKKIVDDSLSFYKKNEEKYKRIDLAEVFANRLSRSTMAQQPQDPKFLATSSRMLLSESLKLIDYSTLRKPQYEAIMELDNFLAEAPALTQQGFFNMPTGSGKTNIFNQLATAFRTHVLNQDLPARRPHVLIVTPTIELGQQTLLQKLPKEATILIDSSNISQKILTFNEEFRAANSHPKIVIICKASLKKLMATDNGEKILERFGLIIVDEMHLVSKDTLSKLVDYSNRAATPMLGFSATPTKKQAFFGRSIYYYSTLDAVKDGFLVPWKIRLLPANAFENFTATADSVETILHSLTEADGSFNHRGIIWVPSISFADDLAHHIRTAMPRLKNFVAAYHTGNGDRFKVLQNFRNHETKILIAVRTLKEGFDHSDLDAVIIAKGVSMDEFVQIRGRALRVSPANPEKVAKIYIAANAISDAVSADIKCPSDLIPPRKTLSVSSWNVVPFPFGTDLGRAVNYSRRILHGELKSNFLLALSKEIYQSSNVTAQQDHFRNRNNYLKIDTNTTPLSALYHQAIRNTFADGEQPTLIIYELGKSSDGEKRYELSQHVPGSSQKVKLLKTTQSLYNNHTKTREMVDHYELLRKLK